MKIIKCLIIALLSSTVFAQKPDASLFPDCRSDQATVIFYRKFSLLGSALRFELYFNDSLLTNISTKSFYVTKFPAGKNKISAQTGTIKVLKKNKSSMDFNFKAGQTYFVRCKAKSFSEGITKPGYKLLFKVLTEKEVKQNIKKGFLRRKLRKRLYKDFVNLF